MKLSNIKKLIKKDQFISSYRSIFTNPFFIIRNGIYKALLNLAPRLEGKLLDVGCGSKPYEELFSVKEYIGLDIEESGHPHENEIIDIFYDGKKIPFEDHTFDSVFASEVFEHVFNLDELIKEINRVIKRDGKLLITVPFVWDEHEIPYDFARYSSFGLESILNQNGFKILEHVKTTSFIETIGQLLISYINQHFFPKNTYINILLTCLVLAPLTLIFLIFGKVLPNSKTLYLNNVMLCKKI